MLLKSRNKPWKIPLKKVNACVCLSKILLKLKVISFYVFEIQEQLFSRNNSFSRLNVWMFLNKKSKALAQIKPCFFFWLKRNVRKMARNKHADLRKIENVVRSKCHPEDISNDKGKKANYRKSCRNFKIVALGEKRPNTEFFLVRIFPHLDWIRWDTEQKIRTRKNSAFGHFSRSVDGPLTY